MILFILGIITSFFSGGLFALLVVNEALKRQERRAKKRFEQDMRTFAPAYPFKPGSVSDGYQRAVEQVLDGIRPDVPLPPNMKNPKMIDGEKFAMRLERSVCEMDEKAVLHVKTPDLFRHFLEVSTTLNEVVKCVREAMEDEDSTTPPADATPPAP